MNFIFGIIIFALFILAVRVIWTTLLQMLTFLKSAQQQLRLKRVQRSARATVPVLAPRFTPDHEWGIMADTVRREIQERNSGFNREANRLEAELQVKNKTMELIKADIQIAKLELELQKVKPTVVLLEADSSQKRKRSKKAVGTTLDVNASKTPHPVHQLRTALKPGAAPVVVSTNENARH
jgi:hypothetical protein